MGREEFEGTSISPTYAKLVGDLRTYISEHNENVRIKVKKCQNEPTELEVAHVAFCFVRGLHQILSSSSGTPTDAPGLDSFVVRSVRKRIAQAFRGLYDFERNRLLAAPLEKTQEVSSSVSGGTTLEEGAARSAAARHLLHQAGEEEPSTIKCQEPAGPHLHLSNAVRQVFEEQGLAEQEEDESDNSSRGDRTEDELENDGHASGSEEEEEEASSTSEHRLNSGGASTSIGHQSGKRSAPPTGSNVRSLSSLSSSRPLLSSKNNNTFKAGACSKPPRHSHKKRREQQTVIKAAFLATTARATTSLLNTTTPRKKVSWLRH
ncbi:unnamed protein product, partial [Amoebophrya sp. A25]|eukprot:GSA25T00018225001.1